MLNRAIEDYLSWMDTQGYAESTKKIISYVLRRFLQYGAETPWEELFTIEMENKFRKEVGITHISPALIT